MEEIQRLKEQILKEYPRLNRDSKFTFQCKPGVSCFNECCGDVNIFLTPYDIIRLKNNLGIPSDEFISKYTISPFDDKLNYPVLLLKMNEDDKKTCPFVTDKGCSVYPDRPWACRMYPLGLASPKENSQELNNEFYFLLQESFCKGFEEGKEFSVSDWMKDQGIDDYNEMGELFKELTLHRYFQENGKLEPQKMEMFFMVCYNVDWFRNFLFKTSFFNKFEVDEDTKNKIKEDDVELLKFGFNWLRFALFGEKTLKIRSDIMAAKQDELKKKEQEKKAQ